MRRSRSPREGSAAGMSSSPAASPKSGTRRPHIPASCWRAIARPDAAARRSIRASDASDSTFSSSIGETSPAATSSWTVRCTASAVRSAPSRILLRSWRPRTPTKRRLVSARTSRRLTSASPCDTVLASSRSRERAPVFPRFRGPARTRKVSRPPPARGSVRPDRRRRSRSSGFGKARACRQAPSAARTAAAAAPRSGFHRIARSCASASVIGARVPGVAGAASAAGAVPPGSKPSAGSVLRASARASVVVLSISSVRSQEVGERVPGGFPPGRRRPNGQDQIRRTALRAVTDGSCGGFGAFCARSNPAGQVVALVPPIRTAEARRCG